MGLGPVPPTRLACLAEAGKSWEQRGSSESSKTAQKKQDVDVTARPAWTACTAAMHWAHWWCVSKALLNRDSRRGGAARGCHKWYRGGGGYEDRDRPECSQRIRIRIRIRVWGVTRSATRPSSPLLRVACNGSCMMRSQGARMAQVQTDVSVSPTSNSSAADTTRQCKMPSH